MKVYYSKSIESFLNDALRAVKSPIAYFLLNKSVEANVSYLEVAEEDKIIVTPEVRVRRAHKEEVANAGNAKVRDFEAYALFMSQDNSSLAYTKSRVEMKMGRLIKKIIEDNKVHWQAYMNRWIDSYDEKRSEDELIEELVVQYKGCTKRIFDKGYDSRIELVKGEDIAKWYYEKNYAPGKGGKGSIQESCMRYERCGSYLDIYIKNPEVCSMLIFKETDHKISMRALVWTLSDGTKYMDRIYAGNSSDIAIFTNYAKRQNWLAYDYSGKMESLEIRLKDQKYQKYPYMDTFKYYDRDKNTLNKKAKSGYELVLTHPEGSYKTQ